MFRYAMLATALAWGTFAATRVDAQDCRPCDSARTVVYTRQQNGPEIQKLREELRAAQQRLQASGDTLDPRTMQLVAAQIRRTLAALERQQQIVEVQANQAANETRSRLQRERMQQEQARAMARGSGQGFTVTTGQGCNVPIPSQGPGQMGVVFSSSYTEFCDQELNRRMVRFTQYPVLASVEPGTGADRAGLEAGDQIYAIDGKDLKEGLPPFSQLLVPGDRIQVKFRRDGEFKTVWLTVGRRPGATMVPAPPTPPSPPRYPPAFVRPIPDPIVIGRVPALAGAELTRIRGTLREYFDVDGGLLVTQVASNTPAARAGLQEGDVIVKANGHDIEIVRDLQEVMEDANDRVVQLEIVRKKKEMKLKLEW